MPGPVRPVRGGCPAGYALSMGDCAPWPADPALREGTEASLGTETPTPAPASSEIPDGPWRVSYADGNGNGFEFEQTSTDASTRFSYSPITPERSSSGTYSGGEPAAGTLDLEQTTQLWQHLLRLEADASLRSESRDKGTGAFVLVTPSGERAFIVVRGEQLAKLDELLSSFVRR